LAAAVALPEIIRGCSMQMDQRPAADEWREHALGNKDVKGIARAHKI